MTRGALVAVLGALALVAASPAPPAGDALEKRKPKPALPSVAKRCGAAGAGATSFRFRSSDGVNLVGGTLGTGEVGVVFANALSGNLCQWLPLARRFVAEGYRALVFDFRDTGLSDFARGDAQGRADLDLLAAIAKLRSLGAQKVAVVGGSLGAMAAIIAGAADPTLEAVVAVSGSTSSAAAGTKWAKLVPEEAAPNLRVPLLVIVGRDDVGAYAGSTQLYDAAAVADKQLVVVPSSLHAQELFHASAPTAPELTTLVLGFVRERI
jgi:pimeloyl-ACP methyl ester carboxylesterase